MKPSPSSPLFTATQLADALGLSRQSVGAILAGVPRTDFVLRRGNMADAWSFAALPIQLQAKLEAMAGQKQCRNAIALLSRPAEPWHPACPKEAYPLAALVDCYKRRKVFRDFLSLSVQGQETRSQEQWERDACAKYQEVFGHAVSGRWLRHLFKLVIERDRGFYHWDRLELFLPEGHPPKPKPVKATDTRYNHQALSQAIHSIASQPPEKLSLTEKQYLWSASLAHASGLAQAHPDEKEQIARFIRHYLFAAEPRLAKSLDALERAWQRKSAEWDGTAEPLRDLRPANSGPAAGIDLSEDVRKLQDLAWHFDGNIAMAHRDLRAAGQLSPEFCDRHQFNIRQDKSYVARTIREAVKPMLEQTLAWRHGPWRAKMDGPHIARDHSGYQPGDWFTGDDVTFNSYFYWEDDRGFHISRGECLVFLDCRSLYPLDYLVLTGHYNGEHIRRGILRVHDQHGLPHQGYHLERGAWEARLMKASNPGDFLPWHDYALGFSGRLGYSGRPRQLITATVPRAKLIEGIFKIVQDRLRADSGFVGFDERDYRQEELQDAIGRVKRGTLDPRARFHSLDGWVRRIGETFTDYLQETQNGKLLDGFSPAELWAARQPLEQLPEEARYILASHCVKTHMTSKGLRLTIRGQSRYYYDAQHSGQYVGQNVLAFYNVETPHMLTVTDLDRKNPFTLTEISLPAFSATKEQFSEAKRAVAGHMQPGKVRFGQIEHPERSHIVHDNSIDDQAGELGRFIQGEQQKDEARQKAAQSRRKKVYTRMARAGVDISGPVRNPESVHRGLELLDESSRQIAQGAAPKQYVLDHSTAANSSPAQYWSLWASLEKLCPALNRHALTHQNLGGNPGVNKMTAAQRAKMIDVFSAILRDVAVKA